MNREIKFRAWNTDDKEMHEVKSLYFGENDYQKVAENLNKKGNHDSFYGKDGNSILMQFTGLKDKNGVKIFEGDLIKHETKQISVVNWSEGDWGWWMRSIKDWNPKTVFDSSKDEIIGNIYENPELLPPTQEV